jgi:hypothetical protein
LNLKSGWETKTKEKTQTADKVKWLEGKRREEKKEG